MRYAIVIEEAGSNYSAYVPDLPGCIATGGTLEEAERQIREASAFHLAADSRGRPASNCSAVFDFKLIAVSRINTASMTMPTNAAW
jgi:predicted RNase H-like HicB family nuclease